MSGHKYSVDVQIGATHHVWSFFACAAGANGGSCNVPTAVALRKASATRMRTGVLVRWRTASESQTLGFNVYRLRQGKFVKVNRSLIPSVFGGTATGHDYSWFDRRAPNTAVKYRLQTVNLDGTRSWTGVASAQR